MPSSGRGDSRADRELELRLWETQGIYLCQTGSPEPGLKLLARCVEKTKDDFSHHSWGEYKGEFGRFGFATMESE